MQRPHILRTKRRHLKDWSGVVSDDRKPVYEANLRMLEKRKVDIGTFDEWLAQSAANPRQLLGSYGIVEESSDIEAEYTAMYADVRRGGLHPTIYPDAVEYFRRLRERDMEIVVISAHPEEHLLKEAEEYGIRRYVDKFYGGVKDKAAQIRESLSERALAEAAYTGDMTFDILAARAAGVMSIGVTTGYHTRERLLTVTPDLLVGSLTELGSLFDEPAISRV